MGALHNKHRNACGEHRNRSESHDNPSEARTRLTLHELLVRSDDQNCDQKKGCQQSVDDSCPVERLDWIDAGKVQPDTHSRCDQNQSVEPACLSEFLVQALPPSLDRTRAVITLEEAFDLQSPMPVFLSIMTPRKPNTQDGSQVVLASESGQGSAVVIDIRNADVSATSEEIPLTDPGLKKTWGPSVFRVN